MGPRPIREPRLHLASEADEAGPRSVQDLHDRLIRELASKPAKFRLDVLWAFALAALGSTLWGLSSFGMALLHGWPHR